MSSSPGHEKGQAMAEFAIVAPIFFLLVFGVLQLGLLFGAQNGLVDGVRDTARKAATYRVDEETFADSAIFTSICSTLRSELLTELRAKMPAFNPVGYHAPTPTITYEWQQNPTTSQYFLVADVSVSYDHQLFVPLVGKIINPSGNNSITLSASEQMRVENPSLVQPASTASHSC
jgi:Flp pilus assembly protein TadG